MHMARPTYPSDSADKTLLRFPEGMRDELRSAAKNNNRSLNAEIIHRLTISLGADALYDDIQTNENSLINVEGLSPQERAQVESFIRFLLSDKGK